MDDLISIIVPVYNVVAYLDKCIKSIVEQTYRNLEILLIDDGSTDGCAQLCDEWKDSDERIVVYHQVNAGLSMARNAGMQKASGSYFMFVDSDDYLSPDAVRVLYERMIQDGSDMAVGNGVCVDEEGNVLGPLYTTVQDGCFTREEAYRNFYYIPCMAWAKLYRRELFNNLFYSVVSNSEDLFMLVDIMPRCNSISLCSKTIYFYMQRMTSIVHTLNDKKMYDSFSSALYACRKLMEENCWTSAKKFFSIALFRAAEMCDPRPARKLIAESISIGVQVRLLKFDVHNLIRWGAVFVPPIHCVFQKHKQNTAKREK